MENNILNNKGGRPPAEITNERIIEVMRMFYRGSGTLGAIMQKLNVSQTTASSLRGKAMESLQKSRGEDDEIMKSKYLEICRLEHLIDQAWKVIDKYDQLYQGSSSVNAKDDGVKLKHLNFILSCQRLKVELNGYIQGNPRNQINFFNFEQKNIINALHLAPDDFSEKNIDTTLLRLTDFYKNGLDGKGTQTLATK